MNILLTFQNLMPPHSRHKVFYFTITAKSNHIMFQNIIIPVLCVLCFVSCSCHKKPTDGGQPIYDPRNISRNASRSYSGTLAVGINGTVHVVWIDDATGQFKTYYSCKPVGGSWSMAVNISGNTTRACSAPQIAIDHSGNLHAVWDELGGSTQPALYITKPAGGAWVTPQDISSAISTSGALPQMGVDNLCKVYVVFMGGGQQWVC